MRNFSMDHEHPEICPYCLSDLSSGQSLYQNATLSVLIPVYNEANTVKEILQKITLWFRQKHRIWLKI